jgi:chromate transporter
MNLFLFFWIFLKASLLSFGGMGSLPFLHKDLMVLGWARESDFITAIAVGQLSPGPNGLWSLSLGYLIYGPLGSLLALIALSLPTLLILVVATFYSRIEDKPIVYRATRGLMLGIIGLTLGTLWGIGQSTITSWLDVAITLIALGLALTKKVPVIVILALAAVAGLVFYGG